MKRMRQKLDAEAFCMPGVLKAARIHHSTNKRLFVEQIFFTEGTKPRMICLQLVGYRHLTPDVR